MTRFPLFFTFFLILGGCFSNDTGSSNPPGNQTVPPPPPPTGQPYLVKPAIDGVLNDPAWLNDTLGASTLRVFENRKQFEEQQITTCPTPLGERGTNPRWTMTIWNRTGTVAFHTGTDSREQPLDLSIPLPASSSNDPPFLFYFWRGVCGFDVTFELQVEVPYEESGVWGTTTEDGRIYDPPVMEKDVIETYSLRWAPGETVAEAIVPADPLRLHVDEAGIPGWIESEQGAEYGDVWMYDALSTSEDDWATHVIRDPIDSDHDLRRLEIAMPGAYRFKGELKAPWPTETVWASGMSLYKLVPEELEKLGFQTPLQYYLPPNYNDSR